MERPVSRPSIWKPVLIVSIVALVSYLIYFGSRLLENQAIHQALAAAFGLFVVANLIINIPYRMQEAHGFYGITRSQKNPIIEANLHNALVIVYADRWLEYGALLAEMTPTLEDDIVYARGSGDQVDAAVIADFPGRTVYYLIKGELSPAPGGAREAE